MLNEYNIKHYRCLALIKWMEWWTMPGFWKTGKQLCNTSSCKLWIRKKTWQNQIVYSDPLGNVVRLKILHYWTSLWGSDSYIKQNGKKNHTAFARDATWQQYCRIWQKMWTKLLKPSGKVARMILTCQKFQITKICGWFGKQLHERVPDCNSCSYFSYNDIAATASSFSGRHHGANHSSYYPCILYFIGVSCIQCLSSINLVLGMIVDNSIVIIDNHVEKVDHRYSPGSSHGKCKGTFYTYCNSYTGNYGIYIHSLNGSGNSRQFLDTFQLS